MGGFTARRRRVSGSPVDEGPVRSPATNALDIQPDHVDGPEKPAEASERLDHDAPTVERLDRALLGIRRAVTLSEITSLPIPEVPGGLDLAKAMACMAIADLTADDHERNVTVKDVAQALALEHSTTSRLLADTAAEGLVERHTDPTDRRRTSVQLTAVGQRCVDRIITTRTWALDALLADWSGPEIGRFADDLERFTTTMRQRLDAVIAEAVKRFIESDSTES